MSWAEDNGYDGWELPQSTSEAYTKGDGVYTNQAGDDVVIDKMPNDYLINAYKYFLKHAGKNNDLVKDLRLEIRLRLLSVKK